MIKKKKRPAVEVDSSSMADIAFLLLIFFLVTTTIASDKGLLMQLPPDQENQDPVVLKQKNIFKVLVNSKDDLLVEDNPMDVSNLKDECKTFLTNRGKDKKSSDNPKKAIVSIKTDRGTSYEAYIEILDDVKRAYHEVRAEFLGITLEQYLALDKDDKESEDAKKYDKARREFPMQISEAEPSGKK